MKLRVLTLAVVVAATPSLATERPLLRPTRDVEVEYRTTGMPKVGMPGPMGGPMVGQMTAPPADQGTEGILTIHYAARTGQMRIDMRDGRGSLILDRPRGRMLVLMSQQHMYMEMARQMTGDQDPIGSLEANAAFTKLGSDTVAGLSCTLYEVSGDNRRARVCLTDDGVLLRAAGEATEQKHELEALRVTYA